MTTPPLALCRHVLIVGAALSSITAAVGREYKLQPGDTLELAVVGIADIRHKGTVSVDGEVSLPLIGAVKASGMSLAELRGSVQDLIKQKMVRQRTDDGREIPYAIEPDEVTLTIAEYRPVYVNGDVSKPGEQPFRADMTARQAVALAGGYDVQRYRLNNPFLEAADLESQLRSLTNDYAQQHARARRLEAELGAAPNVPRTEASNGLVLNATLQQQVAELEADVYRTRLSDRAKEKEHMQLLVRQADAQLKVLIEQRDREEAGVKADSEDLERLTGLFDKGNLTITRVTETRRALLLSSTRLLQTNVQIERTRRDREELLRRLERYDDQQRLDVARDLADSYVQLASTQARVEATTEKLTYTSIIRSQLVKGTGGRPEIAIVRREGNGKPQRIVGEEDTPLLPGDVVEVSLVAEYAPKAAPETRDARPPAAEVPARPNSGGRR